MKEAMWGVGLIMLAIFGILLINLFGSITVTNQQDYTAMKNTVEAAMYDAIDDGLYRSGFCVCTNMERDKNGIYTFNTSSDYEIGSLKEGICYPKENSLMTSCEPIEGEYIINKKVFAESLVRRFAESIKNNYDYQIIINDIIEYPPKVSVNIKSTNSYDVDGGDYTIDNKIDAILEMDSNRGTETHYEIKDNTCLPDDITCDKNTRECRDSKGNLCGELEKPTKYNSCEKIVECALKGENIMCYDEKGNECSKTTITIPKPPTPKIPEIETKSKALYTFSKKVFGGSCHSFTPDKQAQRTLARCDYGPRY